MPKEDDDRRESRHVGMPRRVARVIAPIVIALSVVPATTAQAGAVPPAQRHTSTTTATAGGSVTVPASADTYVVQEQPATAYGSATKITAANWASWHSEALVRFAVPATPKGKTITSARLQLDFAKLDQQPGEVRLNTVADDSWSEATTYSGRPALGAAAGKAQISSQGTETISVNVAPESLRGSSTVSFALTDPTSGSAASFHSREHGADGPRLVIGYGDTAAATSLCGASIGKEANETQQQAFDRMNKLFGGLDMVRIFYTGLPDAWPGKLNVGTRPVVVSFKGNAKDHLKGTYDARMRAWFAGAPRDRDVYWVYYHEPEDNIRDGEFSASEYRAAWKHLSALAKAADNPRLHATMVLMQWSLTDASGRDWRDYYPGDGVLDALGWDVYNHPSAASKGVYTEPAKLLAEMVRVSESVNLPFGVAEMGSAIAKGDDGTRRAAWIRAMNTYLKDSGSLWNLWFNVNWPSGDYRLTDPAGIGAWKDFCAES
ncbi:DNRLRE domain-containing protein [Streptosporangium sp. NPDC004379]|uniref:CBM96 family carbohydrate-binding protein n=1 Tax=Streptosporangium sp. NPDC004379 TaxID=3366189 RepID=UPI0036BD0E5D